MGVRKIGEEEDKREVGGEAGREGGGRQVGKREAR